MKKTMLIAVVILLVGILSAQGGLEGRFAGKEHRGGERKPMMQKGQQQMMMMRIMKNLELSESQQEKLESYRTSMRKESIDIRANIEKKEIDLKAAEREMNFSQIKKLTSEINEQKLELKLNGIDNMEKCWNVLTTEQQAEALELIKNPPRRKQGCEDDNDCGEKMQQKRRRMKEK